MGDGYGLEELIVVQVVGVEHGRGITVGGAAGGDDTGRSRKPLSAVHFW